MRLFGPGTATKPLLLADMRASFLRLVLVGTVLSAVLDAIILIVVWDPGILAALISSAVAALVALATIAMGWESVSLVLVPGGLGLVVVGATTRLDYIALYAALALVFFGSLAIAFIRRRTGVFVAGYVGVLLVVNLIWNGLTAEAIAEGTIMALVFLGGAFGVEWIRDGITDAASRFLNLFQKAPVSLWEEDFSKVGEWLDELRERGVVDLRGYLAANPDVFHEGVGLIEVLRVNSEAARLMEVDDPKDLLGRLAPETLPDDAVPSLLAQFSAIWEGKDHVTVEVHDGYTTKGRRLDGLLHWVVPRHHGEPDLSRVIVSIADVTEMNNARRRLEQSLQSKDELIATVSHELRTPLTTVVGLSVELSDHFDDLTTEEVRELLRLVADQSLETATIVEDLLIAAQAESGSLRVALAPVDLHTETRTTLRGLEVEQEVDCYTVGIVSAVLADSARVRQIIRNLLVNARRYGVAPIRIVVRDTDDEVWLEVRDQGPPIPETEIEQMFERYFRARQTPGMVASAGLGLTLSRDLARAMGGDLTYSHDGESVFTLKLPIPAADSVSTS